MEKKYIILLIFTLLVMGNISATPSDTLVVLVKGTGSDASFDPLVLQIQPGDVIKFEVVEGLHTVTAYHPDNRRPQRIPATADSFNSGMLTAGQSWFLKLDKAGVYDYFCLPHERMGHAGRILVGEVGEIPDYPNGKIPVTIIEKLSEATKILMF